MEFSSQKVSGDVITLSGGYYIIEGIYYIPFRLFRLFRNNTTFASGINLD